MISKKLKNKVLSILLTAAVAVTSVPSMPVMAAMPEGEEEAYISEVEPASADLEQTDSEEMLLESDEEVVEGLLPENDDEVAGETVTAPEASVETPQVEEEQTPQAEEASQSVEGGADFAESVNMDIKVVGSNGVQYSDVAYLSVQAYNSLSDEYKEIYTEMCDTVTEWKTNGKDYKDIVIYLDESGELGLQFLAPVANLFTSGEEFSVVGSITEEGSDEASDTKEDAEEQAEPEDGNTGDENDKAAGDIDKEDGEETDSNTDGENQDADASDDNTQQPADPEDNSDDIDKEDSDSNTDLDSDDTDSKSESQDAEEETAAEEEIGAAEESSNVEEVVEKVSEIISENTELIIDNSQLVSYNEDVQIKELDTYLNNDKYYKNQLDSFAKTLYDYGYKYWITNKKQNEQIDGKSYTVGYTLITNSVVKESVFDLAAFNAVSALINMYPNYFNWMDLGPNGGIYLDWAVAGGRAKYTVAPIRSIHYTLSLEDQADAKVNSILSEAVNYATQNYPANPTYGIVEYFDNWICKNNYYNMVGTDFEGQGTTKQYYYCHSAYGILLEGYGVCESYALAMSRLLDAAGIRNQYVVGDAGGGHAWNYVQMPDNQWYLLDSTWNDGASGQTASNKTSSKEYFLVCDDGVHMPEGKRYVYGKVFKFEKRATTDYAPAKESIIIKPKAKYNLTDKDSFYAKQVSKWSSDDDTIVKVSADGKLTAGKNVGKTNVNIELTTGVKSSLTVYVNNYKISSITNPANGKASYTDTWAVAATSLGSGYGTVSFNVKQTGIDYNLTAEDLQKVASLTLTATSGNKKVAEIYGSPIISGNKITVKVIPLKVGKSKITVKFGGKSASYTLNVKYPLNSSYFKVDLDDNGYTYTGKAFKPKVTKTSAAPKDLKYKVTYENNKDAGTAYLYITGAGNYGGTIWSSFEIKPSTTLTGDVQFVSCTESKVYNGAGQEPKTKVKVGKKTLKQGSDYVLQYEDSTGHKSTQMPKDVGTYKVYIVINNYNISAEAVEPKTFEIKPTTIDKVKLTIPSLKYTTFDLLPEYKADMVVKIGKNVLVEGKDYTVSFKKNSTGDEGASEIKEKGTYRIVITPTGSNVTAGKKTAIEKTIKIK